MEKYYNETNVTDLNFQYFDTFCYPKIKDLDGGIFVGYPFIFSLNNMIMKCVIVCTFGIYYFFEKQDEQNIYKRYIMQQLLGAETVSDKVLTNIDKYILGVKIGDEDFSLKEEVFSMAEVNEIISIFQNIYSLTKKDNRQITGENTIGSMIVERSKKEAVLDDQQFKLIYNEHFSDCNIRVRGLAGCGKTILLAKKMAFLHFKDSEKKMAYVFYTKSLKQSIDSFFLKFYKQFISNPDDIVTDNVYIMHGWGTRQFPGLYSRLCSALGVGNSSFADAVSFESLCKDMVEYIENNSLQNKVAQYDYLFIDEAQDFGINFFKLARLCLKPTGKLIYAYDELQVLNELKSGVPSKEEIFGDTLCEDIDLPECYRTPLEILVTAHALGLGIYHFNSNNQQEMINVIGDKNIWSSIGYINGTKQIKSGKEVSFFRKEIINNPLGNDAVECNVFSNFNGQCEFLVDEITRLIETEDVLPDDILVIDLDTRSLNDDYSYFMSKLDEYFVKEKHIQYNEKRPYDIDLINKDSGYSFKEKGKVSYTTIYRAKGNEANIVFIVNANNNDALLTYNRNRIFTAMTRAKFKVYICGSGVLMNDLVKEIECVRKHHYHLDFVYPTQEEIKKHKHRLYKENKLTQKIDDLFKELDKSGSASVSDELFDILMSKFSEKEKATFIKRIKSDEENKG